MYSIKRNKYKSWFIIQIKQRRFYSFRQFPQLPLHTTRLKWLLLLTNHSKAPLALWAEIRSHSISLTLLQNDCCFFKLSTSTVRSSFSYYAWYRVSDRVGRGAGPRLLLNPFPTVLAQSYKTHLSCSALKEHLSFVFKPPCRHTCCIRNGGRRKHCLWRTGWKNLWLREKVASPCELD